MSEKLVFLHDHKFRRINGRIFSPGGLSQDIIEGYLQVFGTITIIARIIDEKEPNTSYSEIDLKKVKIISFNEISLKKFISIIRNTEYVIARMPSMIASFGILISRLYKTPYMVEVVANLNDSLKFHSKSIKHLAIPAHLLMKLQVYYADYVIYVTKEYLQKIYPTRGNSIGISDVNIPKHEESIPLKREIKYGKVNSIDKIKIGTIGGLDSQYKGQSIVIDSLKILEKTSALNFEYELVGTGDPTSINNYIKKENLEKKVSILGVVPHDKIFDWLDTLDIYIQPSSTEGLPRSVIEAMSRGLLVIGTDVGGIPELLERKYVVSPANAKEEIAYLLQFLDKNDLINASNVNYNKSKEYARRKLKIERIDFFEKFIKQQ